ncbi:MAG: hypothetical protein WKG07_06040 [Hymenobacter sp.]
MQNAVAKLPPQNISRASSFTAQALLSRVYLQQGNYPAALAAADNAIKKSGPA